MQSKYTQHVKVKNVQLLNWIKLTAMIYINYVISFFPQQLERTTITNFILTDEFIFLWHITEH